MGTVGGGCLYHKCGGGSCGGASFSLHISGSLSVINGGGGGVNGGTSCCGGLGRVVNCVCMCVCGWIVIGRCPPRHDGGG